MAKHNDLGKTGELLAIDFFVNKDFLVHEQNWRFSYFEVDIIASHGKTLHFIEVKTRKSGAHGYPEESVSKKKISNLKNAAAEYLFQHPEWNLIQFDVLSITFVKDSLPEFFWIEDVY